jgi:hypothetical protein
MAISTSSSVSTPAFHADDPEQTAYRSLSVLAIISLVLGLAAPFAFIGPLLLAIPLFGIAISLLALRQIAASEGALAGRWAAIVGLSLCIASMVAPYSRDQLERAIRTHQAKEFGRSFIEILTAGQTERAFHMTFDGVRRRPPPEPGAPPPKVSPYQEFLDKSVVKALQPVGANPNIRYAGTIDYQPQSYRNIVLSQQFSVSPDSSASSNAATQPVQVTLTIQRAQLPGEGRSRWLITSIGDGKTAPAPAPATNQ